MIGTLITGELRRLNQVDAKVETQRPSWWRNAEGGGRGGGGRGGGRGGGVIGKRGGEFG